jgi:predicted dehydrogenase
VAERVRFGIAGFGRHALVRLMPAFAASRECRVTALSRRDAQAAETSAQAIGVALAFGSTKELSQCAEVDAVFICSPDAVHLHDVLTALGQGKHVLCEKPMGMNADECRQMTAAAEKAQRLLGVAHVLRYAHSVQHARSVVASGSLGEVTQARAEFHYWNEGHGRTWISDPQLAGGGPLADVGIHCIDALRFVLQGEVTQVATSAVRDAHSGMEGSAITTLEFAHGVLAAVAVSTRAHYRTALEIIGTKGILSIDNCFSVESAVEARFRAMPSGETTTQTFYNTDAFTLQADAFARAIRDDEPFACPGEEGWRNQLVLDAAYRSWKSGRREPVPS